MILQSLLFSFKPETTNDQIHQFYTHWKKLSDFHGVTSLQFGKNTSTEGYDKGYTHLGIVTFPSQESLNRYLESKEHRVFADTYLNPILEDIIIIDIEPES